MRKRIHQIVHVYEGNPLSVAYKLLMIATIVLSLIPLTFKEDLPLFRVTEIVCLLIFVADYLLRWSTADYKFREHRWTAFVRYPLRLISVIDLLSVLALFCSVTGWLADLPLTQVFPVFRIIRIFRYSKNARTILNILKRSRKPLVAVGGLAVGYVLLSSIIVFNVEPHSFDTFFDAVYWATISLTTVGYGDIYPVTAAGRAVAMLSSFFGIAVVALPAGIVTAEYLNALGENRQK